MSAEDAVTKRSFRRAQRISVSARSAPTLSFVAAVAALIAIFGPPTIAQDRFLRTVGFGRAARSAWDATPDWAKQQVNAYVAGVNAYVAEDADKRSVLVDQRNDHLRLDRARFEGIDDCLLYLLAKKSA